MGITYSAMQAKIEKDMDIEDEVMIQDTELMEYFNDAIRDCEREIHSIGLEEIYFKNYDNPAVISGTAEYNMPTGIYQSKILKCVYNDGNRVFPIKEMKGKSQYEEIEMSANYTSSNPVYRYFLRNASASSGVKWTLVPTPRETSSTRFKRWFIREATKMANSASVCDLPDACLNFIYAYVTWRIWGKEGDGRSIGAKAEVELQRKMMIDGLTDMTPDEENEIEMDTDIYEDMS